MKYAFEVMSILSNSKLILNSLSLAKDINRPYWYIAAGVIRGTIWNFHHNFPSNYGIDDIDLVYYEDEVTYPQEDRKLSSKLTSYSGVNWDITNQALVHIWYEKYHGLTIEKFSSTKQAISSWPEICTCIGLRINTADDLELFAPYGLVDLYEMKVARNKSSVTSDIYKKRLAEKEFKKKWPMCNVVL